MGDKSPARQDHDLVDGLSDLGQQVARDQHGMTRRCIATQEVAQPVDALWVETVGGLVKHEDVGVTEEGRGEPEPLPHTQRVAADASPGGGGESDFVEDLVDAAVRDPGGGGEDTQMVATPPAGVEAPRFENGTNVADRFSKGPIVVAVDRGRA